MTRCGFYRRSSHVQDLQEQFLFLLKLLLFLIIIPKFQISWGSAMADFVAFDSRTFWVTWKKELAPTEKCTLLGEL